MTTPITWESRVLHAPSPIVRAKVWAKSWVFQGGRCPTQIRGGIGKGLMMLLDRRCDLGKEIGIWEREVQGVYRTWIRPYDVVWDVGAGDGDSSILLARCCDPSPIVCFEPDRELTERVYRNFGLNEALTKPMVLETAVGARDDRSTVRLDTVLENGVPAPAFLKVDVDGAELDVLAGAQEMVQRHHPVVLIETHSQDLEDRSKAWLREHDYGVRVIPQAWWRRAWPEHRGGFNQWLFGAPMPYRFE